MKKILLSLLISFISINCFSQKVLAAKGYYDSNNKPYIKTTIANDTWKDIVSLVFTIEYYCSFDFDRYKQVVVKASILSGDTKVISYYPPSNYYRPLHQRLTKVIFSDGSYKRFK